LGSAALDMCYVACGRMDLYLEKGPHAWVTKMAKKHKQTPHTHKHTQTQTQTQDYGAGSIIVREAGGVVANYDGDVSKFDLCNRQMAAANPELLKTFFNELLSSRKRSLEDNSSQESNKRAKHQ